MSIDTRAKQYGTIFGNWKIADYLGSGSGGKTAVFKLVRSHEGWEEISALKVINIIEEVGERGKLAEVYQKEYDEEKKSRCEKFGQEVKLMYQLKDSSKIMKYYDSSFSDWQEDGSFGTDLLIRMEYQENLSQRIKKQGTFSEEEILLIGKDIAQALSDCHQEGILHRDIKPANIFSTPQGEYRLGDFGIARLMDGTLKASTSVGTRAYAAPEQFLQNEDSKYDSRVDIYSLGLTLYELANNNRLPFAATSYVGEREIRRRIVGEELPAPVGVSEALAKVILKACAYKPEDRYQNAEELLNALELEEDPIDTGLQELFELSLREETLPQRREKKELKKNKSAAWVLCAVCFIVSVIVLGGIFLKLHQNSKLAEEELLAVTEETFENSRENTSEDIQQNPTEDVSGIVLEDATAVNGMSQEKSGEWRILLQNVKYIDSIDSQGEEHNVALTADGDLYCWGSNGNGQVGNGTQSSQKEPVKVLQDVAIVSAELSDTAAILENGDLYIWGKNQLGQVGNGQGGQDLNQLIPVRVMKNAASVSMGDTHTAAMNMDGNLYTWGNETCNGLDQYYDKPQKLFDSVKVYQLGSDHSAMITEENELYMWGQNYSGQLGTGDTNDQYRPVKVMDDVAQVKLEIHGRSAAVSLNGDLYVWGDNRYCQVGNMTGETTYSAYWNTPAKVLSDVKIVELHQYRSAAITTNGDLYIWGENDHGQVGNDTTMRTMAPAKILENVKSVSMGTYHTVAVTENGELYAWGSNYSKQIMGSDLRNITEPVKIMENVAMAEAGRTGTYVVTRDGTLYVLGE